MMPEDKLMVERVARAMYPQHFAHADRIMMRFARKQARLAISATGVEGLLEALQTIVGSGKSGTWAAAVEPLVARFDVAAKFGGEAVHNQEGSDALAELIRSMAAKLDWAAEKATAAIAKAGGQEA